MVFGIIRNLVFWVIDNSDIDVIWIRGDLVILVKVYFYGMNM